MKRILMTTALVAGPFVVAPPAFADCDQVGSFAAGTAVTCDSTSVIDGPDAVETRGIADGSDNTAIDVLDTATFDTSAGAARAIDLDGDGTTITVGVDATVRSGGADRAINGGNGLKVVNKGLIESTEEEAIQGDDGVDVENEGTIRSAGKGIDANGDGFKLVNRPGAEIESTAGEGVEADGDASGIENRGTIKGFDDAVQVGENAVIFDTAFAFDTGSLFADGGLMDGGRDLDTLTIGNKTLADIDSILGFDDVLQFSFVNGGGLRVRSWESFVFADGSSVARSDLAVSAVPLPAGALLFGSALAGLGVIARRRRRA